MHTKRIIPCLDVDKGRVVKGINFVRLRDAGDPVELGEIYDREGADELVFLDITASHEGRELVFDMAARVAEKVFIPFTVGGGIRNLDDIRRMLATGADKVSLNTAAVENPSLVEAAAGRFGSQCVVVAIDAKRRDGNSWEVYVHGGRTPTGLDVLNGHAASNRSGRERYSSPAWTATGPGRVTTWNSPARWPRRCAYRSSHPGERAAWSIWRR